MKKLLTIFTAFMLVFGFAGNAMAYFDLGDLQLVAYSGEPNSSIGNEAHFDLGVGLDTTITYDDVDTGITLTNLNVASWTNVKVGVFGGGYDLNYLPVSPLFGTDTTDFSLNNPDAGYRDAVLFNSNQSDLTGANSTEVMAKSAGPYWNWMQLTTTAGIYSGLLVNPGTTYGAEAVLNGDILGGYTLYDQDLNALGTFTFDTSGDNLLVSYSQAAPVPVPGAIFLLGSGLMGIIGVRRKN